MGQTSATLCTAASEHFAAIGSTHSLTETVLLGTLALLGLIGTEHAIHLFLRFDFAAALLRCYSTADEVILHAAVDILKPHKSRATQRILYIYSTFLSRKT